MQQTPYSTLPQYPVLQCLASPVVMHGNEHAPGLPHAMNAAPPGTSGMSLSCYAPKHTSVLTVQIVYDALFITVNLCRCRVA